MNSAAGDAAAGAPIANEVGGEVVGIDGFHAHRFDADAPARRNGLAVTLGALALLWLLFVAWALLPTFRAGAGAADLLMPLGAAVVPLVLFAALWLLFGAPARREAEAFTRAVAAMRREAAAMEAGLAAVGAQLDANRERLSGETRRLMGLSDEAADRLGRVAHYLSEQAQQLDGRTAALDAAASHARVDLGVLLADLPRAAAEAEALRGKFEAAGVAAHEAAGGLDAQVAALAARAVAADEAVGGAAQRLGAHLARVDGAAAEAAERIGQAGAAVNGATDAALARAADALAQARSGLQAQGGAMLAMVEQGRAALGSAGDEAARAAAERLDLLAARAASLSDHLHAQDAATHALLARLNDGLGELELRFGRLFDAGDARAPRLRDALGAVRADVDGLAAALGAGDAAALTLVERAATAGQALAPLTADVNDHLPQALARVQQHAGEVRAEVDGVGEALTRAAAGAGETARGAAEVRALLTAQNEETAGLLAAREAELARLGEQLAQVATALEAADARARALGQDSGPQLLDALLRVRDTADAAAERAREAITAVIPAVAATLGEESERAMADALNERIERQVDALRDAAERATDAARGASERLMRQLVGLGQAAGALEGRMTEAAAEQATREEAALGRQMAGLIESLNAAAIDVAKLLGTDVGDAAWAAYLKGDRGVFTRRAVRLLGGGEARELGRRYEGDADVREAVNRYVGDFEAMLRRVLADRDGQTLAVTLLGSDMGKLYVALAQAIERLR